MLDLRSVFVRLKRRDLDATTKTGSMFFPHAKYFRALNCEYAGGQGRDRTADLPLFRRTLVPTELPDLGDRRWAGTAAVLTGFEPATSAVTGRRANQLRHRALRCDSILRSPRVPPTGF